MRVEVAENIPELPPANGEAGELSVKLALQNFKAAMQSDDSLFENLQGETGPVAGEADGHATCTGDFLVTFRDEELSSKRGLYLQLIQKLMELLHAAGSQEVLAAKLCLASGAQAGKRQGAIALRIRIEAVGESKEQASRRWGLGLAHLQQALLFTSRHLRQQISQKSR